MSRTPEDGVQDEGGGGTVDMYGGAGISLSHTPVSFPPTSGGSAGGIDMIGPKDYLSPSHETPPYDSVTPKKSKS